jgi:hypothetical protein
VTLKHEKIRFKRGEIAELHTYPSALDQPKGHVRLRRVYGFGRVVSIAAIAIAGLCVLLVAAVFVIGSFGFSSDRLRDEAQAAISRLAGQPLETRLGPARISLDHSRLVALDLQGVEIGSGDGTAPHIRAGTLRFGLHVMPLLSGRIELGSAALSDAEIDLAAWRGAGGGGDWRKALGGDDGIIDADELLAAVFGEVHAALDSISPSGTGSFKLDNVELRLPAGLPVKTVHVASASVVKDRRGRLTVDAKLDADGQRLTVDGEATRPDAAHERASFTLELASAPTGKPVPEAERADPEGPYFWPGSFDLKLDGDQSAHGGKGQISARIGFSDTQLKFRRSGTVAAGGKAALVLAGGSGKIELSRIEVNAGRSRLVFSGALGPQPGDGEGELAPFYRFELVGNNSVLAPADANEPPLRAAIRVAGRISDDWQRFVAPELAVRTDQGEIVGSASLQLAGHQTPALGLAIAVSKLPVGYAKSLWPWFAAPGAREWALANVYGGIVENSRLVLDAQPGSLGEDKQLSPEEISGHFEVRGARFDITGTIPPVRDAVGAVDFKGTDVDISLASGTVFMPSGRTLAARDGTFRIANAHLHPLIGDLDIQIDGKAAAVAEMGSYDPINMDRFVDLDPKTLTGDVTGEIEARIPLEREAELKDLNWQVDLAYTGLSIDKPFEGQLVTDAKGTISARPDRALIQAAARLNDVPAEISLSEPLKGDEERTLTARLHFDNAARDKLLPGLASVVSGPFVVELEALGEGRQKVEVELADTVLALPWVGWSKGAGVAARANFVLSSKDGVTRLADFRLDGAGFGAAGDITVDDDGLAGARFSRFALNRGDDASASIERRRGGYMISVNGKSLDARPFIRRFGDLTGAGSDKSSTPDLDVSLEARVAEMGGFHDEVLKDVRLAYSAAGTTVGGIRASATTRTGARVTVVDATAGSGRKVEAQASDIGAVLRFLDVYENLHGGTATLSLSGAADGPLAGQIDVRNFAIVNEARLQSIVSKPPPGTDRSLNQAVRRDLDVSQAKFERGFARIEKGTDYLSVSDGVVRGPTIGSTFQGTVFDGKGNMAITGTFMPAYGLNRIFGEIPILGQILGNGRDRGLIGITFKLSGKTSEPQLAINPLSIVAPGIFRSIFEYR